MPKLPEPSLCSHNELKWGRKIEIFGGKEIVVCGRCREEVPAIYTKPKKMEPNENV